VAGDQRRAAASGSVAAGQWLASPCHHQQCLLHSTQATSYTRGSSLLDRDAQPRLKVQLDEWLPLATAAVLTGEIAGEQCPAAVVVSEELPSVAHGVQACVRERQTHQHAPPHGVAAETRETA
jgi:hypothetical protein